MRLSRDVAAGVALLLFCGAAFYATTTFRDVPAMLSQNVPPTFFPRVVLIALALLSLALVAFSRNGRDEPTDPLERPAAPLERPGLRNSRHLYDRRGARAVFGHAGDGVSRVDWSVALLGRAPRASDRGSRIGSSSGRLCCLRARPRHALSERRSLVGRSAGSRARARACDGSCRPRSHRRRERSAVFSSVRFPGSRPRWLLRFFCRSRSIWSPSPQ